MILCVGLLLTLTACGNEDPINPDNNSEKIVGPHTLPQAHTHMIKLFRKCIAKQVHSYSISLPIPTLLGESHKTFCGARIE